MAQFAEKDKVVAYDLGGYRFEDGIVLKVLEFDRWDYVVVSESDPSVKWFFRESELSARP